MSKLAALLGPWPVSSPALAIGAAALCDHAWKEATRDRLKGEIAGLHALLVRHGIEVRGGTDLFVLIERADAIGVHARLARQGIWTRVFREHPRWLRLGLPATDADLARLDAAFTG
jgi:cobalamin biosynthetic protein CobC